MYFTNTPSLNSMEAIMKQPPGYRQRGGGRKRKPYQYTKADCSCRLCPHYQGKKGCAVSVCPVLNIRLECSAAPLEEAVQSTFSEVTHTPFKQRLQRIYKEKRGGEWLPYQNSVHQIIFETESLKLRCPDNKSLAVLYLLTADHKLWSEARRHTQSGQIDLENMCIGAVSPDSYALWKATKEFQTRERQITLYELADRDVVSDNVFRLIVQAAAVARFGKAVLQGKNE